MCGWGQICRHVYSKLAISTDKTTLFNYNKIPVHTLRPFFNETQYKYAHYVRKEKRRHEFVRNDFVKNEFFLNIIFNNIFGS